MAKPKTPPKTPAGNNKPNPKPAAPKPKIEKASPPPKDDDDEEEDEEEEDEGDDNEGGMDKGVAALDSEALLKGLQSLEAAAKTPRSRKQELLEKAQSEVLSAEERQELDHHLSGQTLRDAINEDDVLSKGINVAPALDVLGDKVAAAVDGLTQDLRKSISGTHEFHTALAKSVVGLSELVANIATSLSELQAVVKTIADQPVRTGPKSAGTGQELVKGTGAEGAIGAGQDKLSHREATGVMEAMFYKSVNDGRGGMSPRGTNIQHAMARWMATKEIEPTFAREVVDYFKAQKAPA